MIILIYIAELMAIKKEEREYGNIWADTEYNPNKL
jgi:hypothetical protein